MKKSSFSLKKQIGAAALCLAVSSASLSAVSFDTKSLITVSLTPVEQITENGETEREFGGTYVQGDFALSNDKITAAGKIRYWIKPSAYSSDSIKQRMDIKRAYIRYRPFAANLLEFSLGKFYSYYLPGNYFSLADHYTGSSRWGKTGIGAKFEYKGLTLGVAIPVTESDVRIADYFGLGSSMSYDFSRLNKNIPVKLGANFLYTRTGVDYSSKDDITDKADYDYSEAVSLYYTPKLSGFISRLSLALTYSRNVAPFVSSSAYKHISNYADSDMKKSHFVSWNLRSYFGSIQLITEGEAGHSISGDIVPFYTGTQLLIPVYEKTVYFKPRFFYYAAINTQNNDESRQTFEFYPRAWITAGKYTVSAGVDILRKEYDKDSWKWEWEIPLFVQYQVGK